MRYISTYIESGRTFHIFEVRGEGQLDGFWGVENTLLDERGCLKQTINGVQGHRRDTLAETIASVSTQIKYDKLIAEGYSSLGAMLKIHEEGNRHEL